MFASILKCTNCSQHPKGQFFTFTNFSSKLLWKIDHKLIFNSKRNSFYNSILIGTLTEPWDFTEFLNKLELWLNSHSWLSLQSSFIYYYEIRTEIPGTEWTQAELTSRAKAMLNKTADSAKAPGSTVTLKARSGKVFRVTAPLKKLRSKIRKSAGVFENISQESLGESVLWFICSYFWAVLMTQPPNPPVRAAAGSQLGKHWVLCAGQALLLNVGRLGRKESWFLDDSWTSKPSGHPHTENLNWLFFLSYFLLWKYVNM